MNIRGAYSMAVRTGIISAGLAADAEIFQWRWTDTSGSIFVPRLISCTGGDVVAFAAGEGEFRLKIARTWTANGTSGTTITFAGDDQAKSTLFATTLADTNGGVRNAGNVALGAGTKTLDTNAFATSAFGIAGSAGVTLGFPGVPLYEYRPVLKTYQVDDYPLALAQNEGFVITAIVPATGTWVAGITVDWLELTSR